MGLVLVGIVCVESPGTGNILERTFAVKPYEDKLVEYSESVELLSADQSGN